MKLRQHDIVETTNGIGLVKNVFPGGAIINIPRSERKNKGWCPTYFNREIIRKIGRVKKFK
jgi:hypothetical protein